MVSLFVYVERVGKCGNLFTHTPLPYVLVQIAYKLHEISFQHNDQVLPWNTLNILSYVRQHLLTYLLTYSMVQSPSWEANWFAASHEIPRILWNPKVHYRIHKLPPPVPILG